MRGGIAERGGVRVGHRIIEINSQSVVATPHEKIVHILSNAVGEVRHAHTLRSPLYFNNFAKLLFSVVFNIKAQFLCPYYYNLLLSRRNMFTNLDKDFQLCCWKSFQMTPKRAC